MSDARKLLKQQVADVEAALDVSLKVGATSIELMRHDRLLRTLDRLLLHFPKKEVAPWLLPLSVAVIAISLVGFAAAVRLPSQLVTVDARLAGFSVTVAADGSGLQSDTAVQVESLEIAGDPKAQAIAASAVSISAFRLTAGTTVLLEQRASCLEVELPADQGAPKIRQDLGLNLVVLHPPRAEGQLPTPMDLHVSPGATVTICSQFPANYALAGSVTRIDMYRRQPGDALQGFLDIRTPSIVSGKVRLPQVNRTSDLQDTDMLSFSGVTRGWAVIFPAHQMRIVFSGKVDRAVSLSSTPEGGATSLEPTLLEWLTKSAFVTAVFGLVTGFVGMLWALAKYFGFSSQ
jgi:hypothetical protein